MMEYARTMPASKPSEDDMKRGAEMAKQYADCMTKAFGSATP